MKIYKVYRTDDIGYDEYDAHVVIAKSPKEARSMCMWADAMNPVTKVVEVKIGKKSKIVLSSFNAG